MNKSELCIFLLLSSLISQVSAWTISDGHRKSIQRQNPSIRHTLHHSHLKRPFSTTTSLFESSDNGNDKSTKSAQEWKNAAAKIRLQAQEMELGLTREKLAKVETKLKKTSLSEAEREEFLWEQQSLQYRLDPENAPPPPPFQTASTASTAVDLEKEKKELPNSQDEKSQAKPGKSSVEDSNNATTITTGKSLFEFVKDSFERGESFQKGKEDYQKAQDDLRFSDYDSTGKSTLDIMKDGFQMGFDKALDSANITNSEGSTPMNENGSNVYASASDEKWTAAESLWDSNETEYMGALSLADQAVVNSVISDWEWVIDLMKFGIVLQKEEPEDEGLFMQDVVKDVDLSLQAALAGNISTEELEFVRIVQGGLKFLRSSLPYYVYDTVEDFKLAQTGQTVDPLYLERKNLMQESFNPILFSTTKNSLPDDMAMQFCEEILDNNTKVFARRAKPKKVGAAYLIEGRPLTEDGNELISQLQQALQSSPYYKDKVNVFYIRDPSPQIELDEIQQADFLQTNGGQDDIGKTLELLNQMEPPALLLTGNKLTSLAPFQRNLGFSLQALATLAGFAGSCYLPDNSNFLQTLLVGIQSPILLYLLATFAVQHIVQLLFALKGDFSVSTLPSLFPGIGGLPIASTSISIDSPPKNNNDLFDFAFVGPLLGFLTSYAMIVVGLESTMQLSNAADIAQLPQIDLEFLQQSFLTSATIESVVGTNMLISLGDGASSIVPLSPLAIAGHLGVMIHAIQLLPATVATNGGRMTTAVLGRFAAEFGIAAGVVNIFLLVQAYRGGSPTLYLIAFVYGFRTILQPNMPCLNDVDKASETRLALFAASTLLAFVTLSPAT
jgi:hypothetical protein